mgnify:CR=1 FL=1
MPDKAEFLPFHAINEFMRPDFRLTIIRETLKAQSDLPESLSDELNQKIKKGVSVPGFRNSDKAPALVKVLPTSKAFEKNPDLVSAVLSCWVYTQSQLRDQVYQLLRQRNWKLFSESEGVEVENLSFEAIKEWPILPAHYNRTKLPGFFTNWPKGEDFETIYKNFSELYPDSGVSMDKVSLMVVWLSMRLPFHVDNQEEKSEE